MRAYVHLVTGRSIATDEDVELTMEQDAAGRFQSYTLVTDINNHRWAIKSDFIVASEVPLDSNENESTSDPSEGSELIHNPR